jgi:3-oxoadipate enol-lactonase/4-carboxymuconolactone decarboxylase
MPAINADGCPIYVEVEGPERAPVLMLSNSLGTTLHMWDRQAAPFAQHFRLVRYDRRGHGRSGVPKGPYTMGRLGRDVLAVLDALNLGRINWCGLSMGGMVGQWLGANAPERIERLVLTNTSSYFADKTAWNDRLKLVREKGIPAFAPANMERWFTKGFRERSPDAVAWLQQMFAATPLEGYIACGEAVRDMDHRELLPKIKAPTLVIAGKHDPATPPEANEYIKNHIPGARLALLDAAHISNVEQAEGYTNAVLEFLLDRSSVISPVSDLQERNPMNDEERYRRGANARRKILGDAWVDRADANRNAFNTEWQDFITRCAWGEIWTRPHFDERTRRVLVIGTMMAIGRWEEFRMHVRAALAEGGFSADDIKEIILQQAVYCGVPVGNHAFRQAGEVLEELGKTA